MLTPSQYDQLADSLAELYAQLEESILQDMVRRMLKMGYLSDATEWQARMLQEAGMLYDDILAEIAQRTGSTQEQLRTVFQTAGIQAIRNDNYYYQQANVFTHRSMSDSALQVLNAGYVKCSGNLRNLTLTTANTSQQAFIQACNLAYMQVSSGMMDYNTAVRKAVQNAAQSGSTVLYPSGHKDKLDVAVRRAVLTGVGQTVRQVSFQNAKDLETDLMELTAHAGARPSHAEWQGQIVSLSGRKGYLTTQEIGYGSVDGFGGVNCRHDWHPYFEGLPRTYSPERLKELNEPHIQIGEKLYTDYEVSQMQRALERKIREKKRQVIASQASGDTEEFQKKSAQLKQAEQNLKDFLNQTGFLNDSARLWVNGFGRSQAQKAVWANRKYQQIKNSPLAISSNSFVLPTGKIAETPEILQRTAEQVDKFLDDYATKKSKWSGNAFRMLQDSFDNAMGKKDWNCDILIREDADIKIVIHELLHARSCSYFSKEEFIEHRTMEEATVELYAQEICKKNNLPYSENYPVSVRSLRDVNRILKISSTDFDFGRKMLDMDMKMRYNWIIEQAKNGKLSIIDKITLEYLISILRGDPL